MRSQWQPWPPRLPPPWECRLWVEACRHSHMDTQPVPGRERDGAGALPVAAPSPAAARSPRPSAPLCRAVLAAGVTTQQVRCSPVAALTLSCRPCPSEPLVCLPWRRWQAIALHKACHILQTETGGLCGVQAVDKTCQYNALYSVDSALCALTARHLVDVTCKGLWQAAGRSPCVRDSTSGPCEYHAFLRGIPMPAAHQFHHFCLTGSACAAANQPVC